MGLGTLKNVSFMKREDGCSIEEQLLEQNSMHRKVLTFAETIHSLTGYP